MFTMPPRDAERRGEDEEMGDSEEDEERREESGERGGGEEGEVGGVPHRLFAGRG